MVDRISERELILPSLFLMERNGGEISTSQLIVELRGLLNPQGEDLACLEGRNDDKFSQKVRNLAAHRTFDRNGSASYDEASKKTKITELGRNYLNKNIDALQYLLSNNFKYSDIEDSLKEIVTEPNIEVFDENDSVQEGSKIERKSAIYERSAKLRRYAIDYFTQGGRIVCNCCTFDFNAFYGVGLANNYIEIHHVKPVFKYQNEEMEKTLEKAVRNLMPVCSNCHRVIHRKWSEPVDIEVLKRAIATNGVFNNAKIVLR